jgi:hypothetical protein
MVQKPWGLSLQKSSMPEAEDNANLLEYAKRLLAAPSYHHYHHKRCG